MSTNRMNRRNFLQLSASVTGASLLAACAPAATQVAPEQKPAATQPAVSEGYQGVVRVMSLGDPEKNKPFIEKVEAKFPGVKINWSLFPSEKYTELFAAAEVAGDQIDIMHLNGQDLRRYATSKQLQDLAVMNFDTKRFRQIGLDTYTINGKLWGLPVGGISGFPFLYNKKLTDKVGMTKEPETYEELKDLAAELKKAGFAPFAHQGKNIYMWPVWYFWAYAQTTKNNARQYTFDVLTGKRKFSDPESVAALEMLYQYAQDGMFIESVNSMDGDAMWNAFTTGKAAFVYEHCWRIGFVQTNQKDLPDLDMGLIAPPRMVSDASVKRQLPGGTGDPLGIYTGIKAERQEIAKQIIDFWSQDENVKWFNDLNGDPVSTNANVQASDNPLAVKYAKECADFQETYLDWFWPPEVTRAFQEQQQQLVVGTTKPDAAGIEIQKVLDGLIKDGYKFES
jgi:raffinose/stachyose/melibiose transport system substrate-binding protein